jgi:hypothetical protein
VILPHPVAARVAEVSSKRPLFLHQLHQQYESKRDHPPVGPIANSQDCWVNMAISNKPLRPRAEQKPVQG